MKLPEPAQRQAKVSDLVQSSAFTEQNGIILEVETTPNSLNYEAWYLVHWFSTTEKKKLLKASYNTRPDHREWLRRWEIEICDIS